MTYIYIYQRAKRTTSRYSDAFNSCCKNIDRRDSSKPQNLPGGAEIWEVCNRGEFELAMEDEGYRGGT